MDFAADIPWNSTSRAVSVALDSLFQKTMALSVVLVGALLGSSANALVSKDGVTGRLPAMGWSSWNSYGCDINETVFINVAELINSLGLAELGYEYVNIDDCWSDKENPRNNLTGEINPDYVKFPQGISHVAEKVHEQGLKLGIYSDAGTKTCGGYEGSLGHEDVDAKTFARWGIDYLKYDNCNIPEEWKDEYRWWPELWYGGPPNEDQSEGDPGETSGLPAPAGYDWSTSNTSKRFERMKDAILQQDRVIQYSLCAWGHGHVDQWGNETGQSWRMWGDIYPIWEGKHRWSWGLMPIVNHASFFTSATDFWGHSDYDMLEVGEGNFTLEENRSHFALWAALKSPLLIGTPLNAITKPILKILKNKELIAFNQDPVYGASAAPYRWGVNPDHTWNQTHPAEFWAGSSTKGVHVFILNTLNQTTTKKAVWNEIPGLKGRRGQKYLVHDMWTGKDLGVHKDFFRVKLAAHDTAALRITEVNGAHPNPK